MRFLTTSLTGNTEGEEMKNKVKLLRTEAGWTQETLAEQLWVTRQTVIAIESNRYLPSLGLAFKIAQTFKLPIEAIFSDEEEKDEE